jgi:hypothetical protein
MLLGVSPDFTVYVRIGEVEDRAPSGSPLFAAEALDPPWTTPVFAATSTAGSVGLGPEEEAGLLCAAFRAR